MGCKQVVKVIGFVSPNTTSRCLMALHGNIQTENKAQFCLVLFMRIWWHSFKKNALRNSKAFNVKHLYQRCCWHSLNSNQNRAKWKQLGLIIEWKAHFVRREKPRAVELPSVLWHFVVTAVELSQYTTLKTEGAHKASVESTNDKMTSISN